MYVDGFVIALRKSDLPAYRRMARQAGKIWKEHGALEYRECVADDLDIQECQTFTKLARLKPDETVVFSWIGYKSKAHRNRVNAKVMKDPRIANACDPKKMPFDLKRMTYGGFRTMVEF